MQNSRSMPTHNQVSSNSSYNNCDAVITMPANVASPHISNTSSHYYYHRSGSQLSPVFNPVIPTQSQNLYNGMFGSQASFSNQNGFGFNSYGIVDPPPWVYDSRISSNSQVTETSSKNIYNEKNSSCHTQGASHSSCANRAIENPALCSPLSADPFKILSKDLLSCTSKNIANVDSQTWFCSPGLGTPATQQNNMADQSILKCNDQFSHCSFPQSNVLHEQPNMRTTSKNCFNVGSQVSANKQSTHSSEPHGSNYEMSKDQIGKLGNSHKLNQNVNTSEHMQQKHNQDEHSSIFSTPLEDVLYSHSLIFHLNTDSNQGKAQSSFSSGKTQQYHHSNLEDINKVYDQITVPQQSYQTQRCSVEPVVHCDVINGCFNSETKVGGECSLGISAATPSNSACCQFSVSSNTIMASETQNMFVSSQFSQGQTASCLHNCSLDLCLNANAGRSEDIEDDKENSNQGSSSGGVESDIVVEETGGEEEVCDEDIVVNESEALDESCRNRCFVCDTTTNSQLATLCFIQMCGNYPLTSMSHVPVVQKLEEVLSCATAEFSSLHDSHICRRCLNLVDRIDCLETKLASAKKDLIQLFNQKSSETSRRGKWPIECDEKDVDKYSLDTAEVNKVKDAETVLNVNNNSSGSEKAVEYRNTFKNHDAVSQLELEKSSCEKKQPVSKSETEIDKGDEITSCIERSVCDNKTAENDMKANICRCNVCSKTFNNRKQLHQHEQNHTKDYGFYCDHCERGFSLRSALRKHLLTHSDKYYFLCEICGQGFVQRQSLENHLRRHQGRFRLNCPHCSHGFLHRNSLQIHLRTHTGEKPFICEFCGHSFISVSNLRVHQSICTGNLPFNCEKCDKKFASKTQLLSHNKLHDGLFRFKCETCNKGFMKNFDYKVHLRTHSGVKPHQCSVCGKCYTSVGNLNQHSKKHSDYKPYNCSECGKGFLRKTMLRAHVNLHLGERPFKCTQCNKSFTSSRNLHTHTEIHKRNATKRFICSVCGKSMNHSLKVHMRIHSGHKPYKCSYCEMAFTVKSTLDKHVRTKHAVSKKCLESNEK